jgi:hypothetical protein
MDATDRFKRLVIVILVCFRQRRLKNSAFWVLCAPPCTLAVRPFRAAETAKCSAKPCPPVASRGGTHDPSLVDICASYICTLLRITRSHLGSSCSASAFRSK